MELRQVRSIDQRLDTSFQFFKVNFREIFSIYMAGGLPLVIIGSILGLGGVYHTLNLAGESFSIYLLMNVIGSFLLYGGMLHMYLQTMTLMQLYQETGKVPTPQEVSDRVDGSFWGYVGVSFLTGLSVVLGMMFLLIPGIFLFIAFSVALPVYMIEDKSVTDSLNRSYQLVKGYWWNTAGFVMLLSVIVWVLSFIFTAMLGGLTGLSLVFGNAWAYSAYVFSPIVSVLSVIISVFYAFGVVVQYYHLLALKEPQGIAEEISQF